MLVLLAYCEWRAGKRILANMLELVFPSEVLDPDLIVHLSETLTGCTICIDEIHTVADSRKSGKEQNIQIANFFLQSRHRGVNVIYTDQYEGQVEKRIRDNTDIVIVARNLYQDSDGDGIDDMFEFVIMDLRKETQNVIQIYGKPIFNLYSDAEIIDIFDYKREKLQKRKKNEN